jgi:hypothetical protein
MIYSLPGEAGASNFSNCGPVLCVKDSSNTWEGDTLAQFAVRLLPLLVIASHAMAQDAPRIEFEVVSVKPSPEPDPAKGYVVRFSGGPGSKDPGRFRCTNMNLPNFDYARIRNHELSIDCSPIDA